MTYTGEDSIPGIDPFSGQPLPEQIKTVKCPTSPLAADGTLHTIIGCGALIPDERDDEGLVDCPNCGIWFNPDEEVPAWA